PARAARARTRARRRWQRRARVRLGRRSTHARRARQPCRHRRDLARGSCRSSATHRQCAPGHGSGGPPLTRRSLLVAFSVAHFAHHVTNSLLSALLPFISAAFGLSYTSAGFLVGSYSIASGLTNAPLGVLADRIGPRRVIVWGLVLIGLSSVAIGLSTEYWQLIAFLAVMGIASGTYHAPAS